MRVRGILFDFGNTLFAHAPLAVTIGHSAATLGIVISEDDGVAIATRIDAMAMTPDELARGRDLDATVWRQRWQIMYGLADRWGSGLGAAIDASMHEPTEWIPYPRTVATLRSLASHRVPIGVVSNTGWDIRTVFAGHDLTDSITSFTLSYEIGAVKPDRQIFDVARESLGLAAEELLMVGDDPVADSGAVRAGIRTMLLPALAPGVDNGIGDVLALVDLDD